MRKQRKRGPLTFTKLTSVHYVLGSSIAFQPIIENAQLQFRISRRLAVELSVCGGAVTACG